MLYNVQIIITEYFLTYNIAAKASYLTENYKSRALLISLIRIFQNNRISRMNYIGKKNYLKFVSYRTAQVKRTYSNKFKVI